MNKKGQITSSLTSVAMALLMVAVIAAISMYIMNAVGTNAGLSVQSENSTITTTNDTWARLPYRVASISKVSNNGDGLVADNETVAWIDGCGSTCGSGGYVTAESGSQTLIKVYTNGTYRAGTQTIAYSAYSTDAAMAAQNASAAISTITAWLPLIALVIAAGLIIALLMGAFGGV